MLRSGELEVQKIKEVMKKILEPLEIGYIEILNYEFEVIDEIEIGNTIILVEVIVGKTRLLDNIWL